MIKTPTTLKRMSERFLSVLSIAVLAAISIAGSLTIWFGAKLLRRIRPGYSVAKALICSQAILVLFQVALFPAVAPAMQPPFDDIYPLFFFAPGVHIYWLANLIALQSSGFLLSHLSGEWAGRCGIVFLPAAYGIIFGSVQWLLVARVSTLRMRLA